MKKIKNFILGVMLFVTCLCFIGCGDSRNEIEQNWNSAGYFSHIHIYQGEGSIVQMDWSGDTGIIVLKDTEYSEQQEYVDKYKDDNSYYETTSRYPDSYKNRSSAFYKNDNSIYVQIMWSSSSLYITVNYYG